jgi:hypothetical protein
MSGEKKRQEPSEPQQPAPAAVAVALEKTPTVTEKARPVTNLTVATDEIGMAASRVRTVEDPESQFLGLFFVCRAMDACAYLGRGTGPVANVGSRL